jgi:peptidoglycan hydrolase CwlO-like protein
MSSPKTKSGESVDARTLVLPVSVIVGIVFAVIGGAFAFGVWSARVNDSASDAAATKSQVESLQAQIATMQGSLDALMGMQAAISETRAEVGSMGGRMNSFDSRLQTMDAWIQTTRERLAEQGMQTPRYKP